MKSVYKSSAAQLYTNEMEDAGAAKKRVCRAFQRTLYKWDIHY